MICRYPRRVQGGFIAWLSCFSLMDTSNNDDFFVELIAGASRRDFGP
jgi:hypothetical protein